MSEKMKLTRIRSLLIIFLVAVFLADNAVAAASENIIQQVTPAQTGTQTFDTGDGQPCRDADNAANCWAYCAQSYQAAEPTASVNATPSLVIPAPSSYRVRWQTKPTQLAVVTAPPVVGPTLTILFGNFRI